MSRLSLKKILVHTIGVPTFSVEDLGLVDPPLPLAWACCRGK